MENAELIIVILGTLLGGGGLAAVYRARSEKRINDAKVQEAKELARKITAESAQVLVDSALDLQTAQADRNKTLVAKIERLEKKLDAVIAEMRHWREVALSGRHEWLELLGQEPGWFTDFEEENDEAS